MRSLTPNLDWATARIEAEDVDESNREEAARRELRALSLGDHAVRAAGPGGADAAPHPTTQGELTMAGPEKRIQESVIGWARRTYCDQIVARKIQAGPMSSNGWEDYEILYKGGTLHIEFKAPGERPTPLQAERHRQMLKAGHEVFVIDSKEDGISLIETTLLEAEIKPFKFTFKEPKNCWLPPKRRKA